MSLSKCFRCGDFSYETLRTHSYCVSCNYCDEFSDDGSSLATLAFLVNEADGKKTKPVFSTTKSPERSTERFQAALNERKEMESAV